MCDGAQQQAAELNSQVQDTEERLQALQQQHSRLRNASADTIQALQQTLLGLERSCSDLQVGPERGGGRGGADLLLSASFSLYFLLSMIPVLAALYAKVLAVITKLS